MSHTNKSVRATCTAHEDNRAVVETLARIGDKWTVLVVGALHEEPMRYNEIRRVVDGISQRMLTLTLRGLEQEGLVKRTMYPTIPPRVDYELTELGRRWFAGGRYDWSERALDSGSRDRAGSLLLTYSPSEFSQIRGQLRRTSYAEGGDASELLFQFLFSIGAHGAHPF